LRVYSIVAKIHLYAGCLMADVGCKCTCSL
jgi:hypothetical protein